MEVIQGDSGENEELIEFRIVGLLQSWKVVFRIAKLLKISKIFYFSSRKCLLVICCTCGLTTVKSKLRLQATSKL